MEKTIIICSCICIGSCVFVFLGCIYITRVMQELREIQSQCAFINSETHVGTNINNAGNQEVLKWSNDLKLHDQVHSLQQRSKRMVPNFVGEVKRRHKRKTKDKKKKGKRPKTKAGHYITFAHTDDYVKKHVTGYDDSKIISGEFSIADPCTYISELRGTLCRSKDFFVNNTQGSIHVFKPSSWTTKKLAPFTLKDNGEFQAKTNGIYFVYAQVLFNDNKYMQAITLQHKEAKSGVKNTVLSCYSSGGNPDQREVFNTCSMHGLVSLKKKDILTVELDMQDVKLHMRKATTYFGAFIIK